MARRKQKQSSESSEAGWMATYGDLVTLLLTFFVLLYSFSSIDAAKWEEIVRSFSGASGVMDSKGPGGFRPEQTSISVKPDTVTVRENINTVEPQPTPETKPEPEPEYIQEPEPVPEPEPTPEPELGPDPEPAPEPEPEPIPAPKPKPEPIPEPEPEPTPAPEPIPVPDPEPEKLDQAYKELYSYMIDMGLTDSYGISKENDQLTISLLASVVFSPGSDDVVPEAESILSAVSKLTDKYVDSIKNIRTEGIPMASRP